MNDFLSSDEIERLVQQAGEGTAPADLERDKGHGGRRTRGLRTVDFARPTKFTSDQERRVRRLLDSFCQAVPQRIMAEHRLPVELEIIDVQQLTWTSAMRMLPERSVYTTIECQPHGGKMLMSVEVALLCTALEGLLGGDAGAPAKERELTDIDLILVRRLMRTLVDALSALWFDQAEVTLQISEVQGLAETVQVAAGAEPTLAIVLEGRLQRTTHTLALLVPYAAIAPVAAAFSQRETDGAYDDPAAKAAVREGLHRVDVTLRTEVSDTVLTLEEVLALRPGDEIRLSGTADGAVTVYADSTPVHQGRAGRSGTHRAVQITGPVEVPE